MIETFWGISSVGWQAIGVIVTTLTFTTGAVAATSAARTLRFNRKVQDLESRPYVIADLKPNEANIHLKDFVITNIGTTPAYRVGITFDPPPVRANEIRGHELKDTPMFVTPIEMLPPGRSYSVFFDSMIDRTAKRALPMKYVVTLNYTGTSKPVGLRKKKVLPEYTEKSTLDIMATAGTPNATVKRTHDLVEAVEGLSKLLARSAIASRELRVTTETRDERDRRSAAEDEESRRAYEEIQASVQEVPDEEYRRMTGQ